MKSWASDFLDEDNNDMGDPSYFFQRMLAQSRQAVKLTDDTEARLAALHAISGAAHKGRVDDAERELHRIQMEEEYYGAMVLLNNGICPECLGTIPGCECEGFEPYDETICHVCGFPGEMCECEDAADGS